jgi:hypothetical protein
MWGKETLLNRARRSISINVRIVSHFVNENGSSPLLRLAFYRKT